MTAVVVGLLSRAARQVGLAVSAALVHLCHVARPDYLEVRLRRRAVGVRAELSSRAGPTRQRILDAAAKTIMEHRSRGEKLPEAAFESRRDWDDGRNADPMAAPPLATIEHTDVEHPQELRKHAFVEALDELARARRPQPRELVQPVQSLRDASLEFDLADVIDEVVFTTAKNMCGSGSYAGAKGAREMVDNLASGAMKSAVHEALDYPIFLAAEAERRNRRSQVAAAIISEATPDSRGEMLAHLQEGDQRDLAALMASLSGVDAKLVADTKLSPGLVLKVFNVSVADGPGVAVENSAGVKCLQRAGVDAVHAEQIVSAFRTATPDVSRTLY